MNDSDSSFVVSEEENNNNDIAMSISPRRSSRLKRKKNKNCQKNNLSGYQPDNEVMTNKGI